MKINYLAVTSGHANIFLPEQDGRMTDSLPGSSISTYCVVLHVPDIGNVDFGKYDAAVGSGYAKLKHLARARQKVIQIQIYSQLQVYYMISR